jgi:hypothetical protein
MKPTAVLAGVLANALVSLVVSASATLSAQVPPVQGGNVPPPPGQLPMNVRPYDPYQSFDRQFNPADYNVAPFQGFPMFPPSISGYGLYQPPPGWGQPPTPTGPPVMLLPEAPNWPSWLRSSTQRELPYTVDQAVLVRHADRVWLKTAGDAAFVPLYFFDGARAVTTGTAIEVRQTGEFQLLLHGGSRVFSFGEARLQLGTLDQTTVALQIGTFTRMHILCRERAHDLTLPDGSHLRVAADPEPTGECMLVFARDSEPRWRAGRGSVFNAGRRPVHWSTPLGDCDIASGQCVSFFLQPSKQPLPYALSGGSLRVEAAGGMVVCRAEAGADDLTFSGARIHVPAGGSLTLDPLLGEVAPPAAAARPQNH